MILKTSAIYLASGLVSRSVPFILLPVLTAYLTPSEFGLVAIIQISLQFLQGVSGLSLHVNIPRKFFVLNKYEMGRTIFNLYFILVLSCSLALVLLSLLVAAIDDVFGMPQRWVLALPVLAFMNMSILMNLTLLRTREKAWSFFGFEVSYAFLNLLLSVYLVIFLLISWEGRIIAIASSMLLFGVVAIYSIWRQGYLKNKFDMTAVKEALSISLPLLPHSIAVVMISVSDRLFIERMVGLSDAGIYTVGYYFGMVVMLFTDAFVKAWAPWFYRKMARPSHSDKNLIVKYTYGYITALFLGTAVYVYVAMSIFPYVVSADYMEAERYIPWVCAAYVPFGVYQIFFLYLVHCGATKYVAISTTSAAVVNVVGNYFFILEFGAIGAAYSTLISFAVSAVIMIFVVKKIMVMPWNISFRSA